MRRIRVCAPNFLIKNDQAEDRLPGKKAVKTVLTGAAQGFSREPDESCGANNEGDEFVWHISWQKQR